MKKKKTFDIEKFIIQYNFKNQVVMYNNLFIIAGFADNSFKVFDTVKNVHSAVYFHKKLVTCLDICQIDSNKPILAVGSRDCRVSVWKLIDNNF